MRIRIHRLCALILISLLSLFALAAHAAAQGHIVSLSSRSPNLGSKIGKTHVANSAQGTARYEYGNLYSFCTVISGQNCADGYLPGAGVIQDAAGNLYGTTAYGGTNNAGTVFKLDSTGQESVLYSFCSAANCADGSYPKTGLIRDAAGILYGTTSQNGANNKGLVFKLDSTGKESVLYSFYSGGPPYVDGQYPASGLIQDAADNLYGTTAEGGANNGGTVFKLDSTGAETVLYSFCSATNCGNGSNPRASLIQDAAGNLYGTTVLGGANNNGIVFKLDTAGRETVLYSFCSAANCADGSYPETGLIQDSAGNLYGTTNVGGANNTAQGGAGVVFKLDNTGHETVLYSFCAVGGNNCTDGAYPQAGLLQDAAGTLYGTTYSGGANGAAGVVFEVDTSGNYTVLYSFCAVSGCTDGQFPLSGLIQDAAGNLYGTTTSGGATGNGTVFQLAPTTFTVGGTAVTVSPGATSGNTSTITLTPNGGFTGSVTLTAAITSSPTGAQDPPTLSFGGTSPASITGTSAVTATLTVATTAPTTGALAYPAGAGTRWSAGGATLAFGMFFGIGIYLPARRRSWRMRLGLLALLVILAVGLLSCSNGSGNRGTSNPGTTPGAYTVTVTGTSGSTTATTTVTLTVQ